MTLLDFFKDEGEYQKIMDILVDRRTCDPGTHFVIDQKKGFKNNMACLLKVLHSKGFYKDNRKPTSNEIQIILKNTFALELGIDTIKRADPLLTQFDYIPISLSL